MRMLLVAVFVAALGSTAACGARTSNTLQGHAVHTIPNGCADGYPGTLDIDGPADPDLLLYARSGCQRVQGDLNMDGYSGSEWPGALRSLLLVKGSIYIQHTQLQNISLSQLITVGGRPDPAKPRGLVIMNNPKLASIDIFGELSTVGADVAFIHNGHLTQTEPFPKLRLIGGALAIAANPSLVSVGSFPALQTVHTLTIHTNTQLSHIGSFDAIVHLSGHLSIYENPHLHTIGGFPHLSTTEALIVKDNGELSQCRVQQRMANVSVLGDSPALIEDNDTRFTCH